MKLKNILMLLLVGLLLSTVVQARDQISNNHLNLHLGIQGPDDAKSGLGFGGEYYWLLDQTVSYGLGLDIYYRTFSQTGLVQGHSTPGWNESDYPTEVDYKLLMATPRAGVRLIFGDGPFKPAFRFNTGIDLLNSSVKNNLESKTDNRFFAGWSCDLVGGVNWQIGERSQLFGEVGYHWGKPSRSSNQKEGLPIRTVVNMGGPFARIGLTFLLSRVRR